MHSTRPKCVEEVCAMQNTTLGGFYSGQGLRTLQYRGWGFDPSWGNFEIPYGLGQLSQCAATTEPTSSGARAPLEKIPSYHSERSQGC